MRKRPDPSEPPCPHCQAGSLGPRPPKRDWFGGRELLLGAAIARYVDDRCEPGHCESIEVVSTLGCRAKVRVVERRFDTYGDEIGLFRVDEGFVAKTCSGPSAASAERQRQERPQMCLTT